MKVLVWAALIVAVTCARINQQQNQSNESDNQNQLSETPWIQGRLYTYNVQSRTLASLHEGSSSGSATKAQIQIYVKANGHLQAKVRNAQHAKVHSELQNRKTLPKDLKYEPAGQLEQPFEFQVQAGRVQRLSFPQNVNIETENLLKGFISALHADLTVHHSQSNNNDNYDHHSHQGQFRKMETDVTGECLTLYNVAPISVERRRDLPEAFRKEPAVEISKSKDYGKCNRRVAYNVGVPSDAEWTGTAHKAEEYQFMKRATNSRLLVGPNGIYAAEMTSTVHVSPLMYGKQKAEVYSNVKMELVSYEDNAQPQWKTSQTALRTSSLLYSLKRNSAHIENQSISSSRSAEDDQNSQEQQSRLNKYHRDSQQSQESNQRSSSSSESNESYENANMPNENEPAYSAFLMSPQSKEEFESNPTTAQKLTQEIAQQLQNPNAMPKADTLSKFTKLVRVISAMTKEQLAQTSRGVETAKSSNNAIKKDMWMVYRDAVTQAGTIPAFQQIKSWIQTKKIQGEEAAQVVASLASSLRYPTKEIMQQFFNLAFTDVVSQQNYLNSTTLISATRMMHMAHVNRRVANSQYPTKMYGSLIPRHDYFIENEIVPRLREEMDNAIARGDSHKALVMIKAIGNLGHYTTIQAYAPYLQGKIPASTYVRRFMVENLDNLAYQQDHNALAVLYSLLRNTAEPNEIRVAAAVNMFLGNPPTTMMQAMAQMTNDDPSIQVRAAIQSQIKSAAQLKDPRQTKLARTAQEVYEILSKENYSPFYSSNYLNDYFDQEQQLSLNGAISYIASENSMLAKLTRIIWSQNAQQWNNNNQFSASFSDPRQSIELLKQQLYSSGQQPQKPNQQANHKYSAQKVAQLLNYQKMPQQQAESAISFKLANQERFFTADDLKHLPHYFKQALKELPQGNDYHYTKIVNRDQIEVVFPLSTGMPFVYKYKEPILVHLQGKTQASHSEVQFTYAKNIKGSVGFYDTLSEQYARAGIVSKSQVYIPIKASAQMKEGQLKVQVEFLRPEQDANLLHSSFWPYTAITRKNSHTMASHDPETKVISRVEKTSNVDAKFGQAQTGMQFHLQGYSYAKDHSSLYSMFKGYDVLSAVLLGTNQRDMALSHFNLKYVGKNSPNKRIAITANYDIAYNRNADKPLMRNNRPAEQNDVSPNSDARRQEMLNRVSSGIKESRAQVLDVSASFEGSDRIDYVLTVAQAESHVDPTIQYALFAAKNNAKSGNTQTNAQGTVVKAGTYAMNFADAVKQGFKTSFDADFMFGKDGTINIDGSLKRSQSRVENAQKDPMSKACLTQMQGNNDYQPACKSAIEYAHVPDQLKASITYKNVSPALEKLTFQAYSYVRRWMNDYISENIPKKTPEGKLEVQAQLSDYNTIDVQLNTRIGEIKANKAPVPQAAYKALTMYSPLSTAELLANYYLKQQFLPNCAVDGSIIKTFSNRSYEYAMPREWHVVMQDEGQYSSGEIAILAKRPNERQQEVYISYQSPNGEAYEVKMKPTPAGSPQKGTVEVQTNLKRMSEGAFNGYWNNNENAFVFKYYPLQDGVIMAHIDNDKVRMLYDGQRLVIYANENRNSTRGICGRMSGDPMDDYITPQGYVDSGKQYAASYALNQEDPNPETDRLQQQAKKNASPPHREYTNILHSDSEWKQYKEGKQHQGKQQRRSTSSSESYINPEYVYRVRSYKKESGQCQQHQQVQYFENQNGEICISATPLLSCSSQCHGSNHSIQPAQVYCRPYTDAEFRSYRDQIRQGHNPQVPQVGNPQQIMFRVPASCSQ